MLHLKNIIRQLSKEDFQVIANKLISGKAEKSLSLLNFYKAGILTEDEIIKNLEVNSNGFYVLKHRLFEKIQEFLQVASAGSLTAILQQVVTIPNLVFSTDRKIATAILKKLEKELIENDMPHELTSVYGALKKIHSHSDKYFEYSQCYNKHIAYTFALEKAEDLLYEFVKKFAEYYSSRDHSVLSVLPLLKKEMFNTCALYKSHRLTVYQNLMNISMAIFLPVSDITSDDKPIEDLLDETESILLSHSKDPVYHYLNIVLNFLAYEYYHKHKLHKKEMQYFELMNSRLPSFLYFNHTCFCSKFLITKMETYLFLNKESSLKEENVLWLDKYQPEPSDAPNYINYVKYLAASAYYSGKYIEASKYLSDLLNDVSFKHYPHSEIEIKLFLTLTYSLNNKYDLAWNLLRSAIRKIDEYNGDGSYENAGIFAKMLKLQMSSNKGDLSVKLRPLKNQFELLNQGNKRLLEYIRLDEKLMQVLSKPVK